MTELALAIVQHPIGGLASEAVSAKAIGLVGSVVTGLTSYSVTS